MDIMQMSLSAAVLIIAIVVIRALAIHRLPKKTFLVLWSVALCRLLIPFSIPSRLSIYTFINWFGVSFKEEAANTSPTIAYTPYIFEPIPAGAAHMPPVLIIWLIGTAACALFFIVTYIRCCREFQTSLPVNNDFITAWLQEHRMMRSIRIRQSDKIVSPLTYGIWHPTVLLPKTMDCTDETTLRYVLTHEFEHIRRFDTLYKLLLAAAFCIHWFNPLVWVMYILANRDIELSCDEATVRTFGETAKSTYALMLIGLEEKKGKQSPFCTNFSKNAIEERIVSIMKISKKASIFTIITALAVVAGVSTAFATSALSEASDRMQSASISGNQGEIQVDGAAYHFTINDDVITVKDADGKIVSTATADSEGTAVLKDADDKQIGKVTLEPSGGVSVVAGAGDSADIPNDFTEIGGSVSTSGNQGEIQVDGAVYRFTIDDDVITVKDANGKIVSTATADSEGNAILKDADDKQICKVTLGASGEISVVAP